MQAFLLELHQWWKELGLLGNWKFERSYIYFKRFTFCNAKWYFFFLEYFNIFSDFIFQDCLCWFLHYESHSVGERLLSCHPFWHFGCYSCYVVWNFSPTNLCWCLFWLQREGKTLWIQIWNTLSSVTEPLNL